MKRFIFLLFSIYLHVLAFSQGFKVMDLFQNVNDGSAFHAPMDNYGNPCALIKVRSDDTMLQFGGSIVGEVENKTNEYWVYLSKGSNMLWIKHPNFMPQLVLFRNYGIDMVMSKCTYIMTLKPIKYKEKNCLVVTTNPSDAFLFINDGLIENLSGNGLYRLFMEKGEYVCRVEKNGYRKNVQVVSIGKMPQNINVELESVMAELDVKCKMSTAEIYIDGELKGTGEWKGSVLAGDHIVEAKQQNYESTVQKVSIAEKENIALMLPALKRFTGKLKIITNPSGINIQVDGKNVGISPCTVEIETGLHYVNCRSYGIELTRNEIEVKSGMMENVSLEIQYKGGYLKEHYKRAYNGYLDDILYLTIEAGRQQDSEQAFFWISKHPQKDYLIHNWHSYWNAKEEEESIYGYWQFNWIEMYSLAGNPEKALELYPITKADVESDGEMFLGELNMMYIGDAFFKKKEYDKAINCYEKSGVHGYEGLGDCYAVKGNKQLAASYYRKSLNSEYYKNKKMVENKLKELGN